MAKAKVQDGYQINHQGKIYRGGDSVDAPQALIDRWASAGLVESKAQSGSKNKAITPEQAENKGLASKSKEELYEMAQEQDIEGRSGMDKDELVKALGG